MKKRIILLLIVAGFFVSPSIAQSKFHVLFDYHYNLGLYETASNKNITRSELNMYGNSLHLSALYNINNRLALGAGVGVDRYDNPGYNTLPIFATVHYAPLTKLPNVYAYTNLGYSIGGDNFYSGMVWDLGAGYKWMFSKHFGLNFQLGYDLKQFRGTPDYTIKNNELEYIGTRSDFRQSLSFGLGLIF